jgi:hypothetical protein
MNKLMNKVTITNSVDLGNGKELVSYFNSKESMGDDFLSGNLNISTQISAAIAAYARIHLYYF